MCSGARSSSAKGAMARRQASASSWSTSSSSVLSLWTMRGPFTRLAFHFPAFGRLHRPRARVVDHRPTVSAADAAKRPVCPTGCVWGEACFTPVCGPAAEESAGSLFMASFAELGR